MAEKRRENSGSVGAKVDAQARAATSSLVTPLSRNLELEH